MTDGLLDILECPFCGDRFELQPSPRAEVRDGEIVSGILRCQCCAYPILDRIPVIRTNSTADSVMELLGAGRHREALELLLGLKEQDRASRFVSLLADERTLTFRTALDVLSPDAEGAYLLYRFSDPTFICAQAILQATLADRAVASARPLLDVCGGAGHLARTLSAVSHGSRVVVADIAFWKLWLAKRFVAPHCEPVCCDAAVPLPFARAAFSMTCCCDALHYVWPRRLLAGEMMRATAVSGTIVAAHLHNALCENHSPGMPLTAAGYRHLFAQWAPALSSERDVLDAIVAGRPTDVGTDRADADLAQDPALVLVAGRTSRSGQQVHAHERHAQNLHVNPLYVRRNDSRTFQLRFPSDFYAEEFGDCRRYLPEQVELPEDWSERWTKDVADLVNRRVLLDLPPRYL